MSKQKLTLNKLLHGGFFRFFRHMCLITAQNGHVANFYSRAVYEGLRTIDGYFSPDIGQIIVLQPYNAIFFAIPKVANSSLKTFFANILELPGDSRRYGGKAYLFNHSENSELLHLNGIMANKFQAIHMRDYWKFAIVRNPWDRLVSFYTSAMTSSAILHTLTSVYGDMFWQNMQFEDFAKLVCQIPDIVSNRHFMSQYKYLVDGQGHLIPNFVGKFETLNTDFQYICDHLAIDSTSFQNVNRGARRTSSYREHYSPVLRDAVADRYRKDIQLFNYTF